MLRISTGAALLRKADLRSMGSYEGLAAVQLFSVRTSCCLHESGVRLHGALLSTPYHQDPAHADPAQNLSRGNLLAWWIVSPFSPFQQPLLTIPVLESAADKAYAAKQLLHSGFFASLFHLQR